MQLAYDLNPVSTTDTTHSIVSSEAKAYIAHARGLKSITLTARQICDIELLINGGFAPLNGYLGERDYDSVLAEMRLTSGELWPIPISLDIEQTLADSLTLGDEIALRDAEGLLLAILKVSDCWKPDLGREAEAVFGMQREDHPGVKRLVAETLPFYVGGIVTGIQLPQRPGLSAYCKTPQQLRHQFAESGWDKIVAFQTRNPMHRGHEELATRIAKELRATLLLHPVVGPTLPGDIDALTRMRCYAHTLKRVPEKMSAMLAAIPLAMRLAGPREALWHALIRRNYACTHFIVGRDHAGPGKDSRGFDFYPPSAAQQMVAKYQSEIGINLVHAPEMLYLETEERYVTEEEILPQQPARKLSGTALRRCLEEGSEVPHWLAHADVVEELRRSHPPKADRGLTIFFTGLSGSGKSTIAKAVLVELMQLGSRTVTLLDGDVVRQNLSSELGFSRAHRDLNICRIGYVASEITKHRGIAICAPIAPYAETRRRVRELVSQYGGFFEVFVSTPLQVCEERDPKGLYVKARAGLIPEFTGISDPYETPTQAEVTIDTRFCSVTQAVHQIITCLRDSGYMTSDVQRTKSAA